MTPATLNDLPLIHSIINDPALRGHLGGEGELDPTPLLRDKRNRFYADERGGCVFAWRGPGIYETHLFYRVGGKEAREAFRGALESLGARMVWGLVPEWNRKARMFGRLMGFASHGMMTTPDLGSCELFVLENAR